MTMRQPRKRYRPASALERDPPAEFWAGPRGIRLREDTGEGALAAFQRCPAHFMGLDSGYWDDELRAAGVTYDDADGEYDREMDRVEEEGEPWGEE